MKLCEALDRTLLLMRDDVSDAASDEQLIEALTETKVCIIADKRNIGSHSAQTAFVTAAMLMGRSAHQVYLNAPDVTLCGSQPPLGPGDLIEQLEFVGKDLLPGCRFKTGDPKHMDVAILLGDTEWRGSSKHTWRLRADAWTAHTSQYDQHTWPDESWPVGGMASAAFAASEAFKFSMRKLASFARDLRWFAELYAPTPAVTINLATGNPTKITDLGSIDFVSAGAITNCALYVLFRLPDVSARVRVIDDDTSSLNNMNRGILFLRSKLEQYKAVELARYQSDGFSIIPLPKRYNPETVDEIGPLADAVMVGVDDIPSRWEVQKAWPSRLGIGATSHYSAMASYHTQSSLCWVPAPNRRSDPWPNPNDLIRVILGRPLAELALSTPSRE